MSFPKLATTYYQSTSLRVIDYSMTQHQAQIFKIHGLVCQDCQDFFLPIFSQTQKVYSAKKFSEFSSSSVHVVVVVVPWLGILRGL